MTRRELLPFLLAGAMAFFAAMAGAQQIPENPVVWTLAAKESRATIRPGTVSEMLLTANIDRGWRLYGLQQPDGGPQPTRITARAGQPFEIMDLVEGPPPLRKQDKTFGIETEVYERTVTFTAPVRVAPQTPPGTHKLKVQVTFQACSDVICLFPKTATLELALGVSSSK